MREKLEAPPINYATHPRYSALVSGGIKTTSGSIKTTSGGIKTTSGVIKTTSMGPPAVAAVPPPINYATKPIIAVEEQILSLADALKVFSTNDSVTVVPTSPRNKAKYYSVVVGRCCGLFCSWATVFSLVKGIPGSRYTGFRTYEGAYWDYYTAKKEGKVRVVRGPGDEFIFGPLSRACM